MSFPADDIGFISGTEASPIAIPAHSPHGYNPGKGEIGALVNDVFLPMEHPAFPITSTFPVDNFTDAADAKLPMAFHAIDRDAPWLPQTTMKIATPCIIPYDWSKATALRTMILDTALDADVTPEERALPGYVENPGLMLRCASADIDADTIVLSAGFLFTGKVYEILTVGTTDFTQIGAADNNVGTSFTATAVGAGTGKAAKILAGSSMVNGTEYTIVTNGIDTDFTALGAANNNVGTTFTSTGYGWDITGTGTVTGIVSFYDVYPGVEYTIVSVGTTDFTIIGAPSNTAGITFTATDYGWMLSGNGQLSGTMALSQIWPGGSYTIKTLGANATDFTAKGASSNDVGTTFTATGPTTSGNGTVSTIINAGSFNANTLYTIVAYSVDAGDFIVDETYTIETVGTTDFTLIGAANNDVGTVFVATGAGTGTGTATTIGDTDWVAIGAASNTAGVSFYPRARGSGTGTVLYDTTAAATAMIWTYNGTTPTPATRTASKNGTDYADIPFLPAAGTSLISGTLKARGYRKGMQLSDVGSYDVAVKIGRATATWDADAQTLTLACSTAGGATIKYSTNGTTPTTTYSTPISITGTTTVRWICSKTGMTSSDEFQTVLTYDGATPPADFETVYFSTLPVIPELENEYVRAVVRFQQRPRWYISPAGSGDGRTPATPSNATTVIGLNTTGAGKALGARYIAATNAINNNKLYLSASGSLPTGYKIKYSTDGTTFSTYSTEITPDFPRHYWLKLTDVDDNDITETFRQPWFVGTGTGVQLNAVWDLSEKTLTLTYEPAPDNPADIVIRYNKYGTANVNSTLYTGPITIGTEFAAGTLVNARKYRIKTPGDTDWTAHGAADNNVGTVFTCNTTTAGSRAATALLAGKTYIIKTVGTTDFTLIGATANTVGLSFTATGAGTGTGTVNAQTGTGVCTETDITVRAVVIHPRSTDIHNDYATSSASISLTLIDPEVTADYDTDTAVTLSDPVYYVGHYCRQPNDIVWASEGTYEPADPATWFKGNAGVVLRGGYNSTFTERDITARKSQFGNIQSINLDGLWLEVIKEFPIYETKDAFDNATTGFLATFPALWVCPIIVCCNINVECLNTDDMPLALNTARGTSGPNPGLTPLTYALTLISSGTCYDCTITIQASLGSGVAGVSPVYFADPDVGDYDGVGASAAGAGGSTQLSISVGVGGTGGTRNTATITATVGDGGNGWNETSATADGVNGSWLDKITRYRIGGPGGHASLTVNCNIGTAGSTSNITATCGNGGAGGNGGDCTGLQAGVGYWPRALSGGTGGNSTVSVTSTAWGSTITATCGNGGDGGDAGGSDYLGNCRCPGGAGGNARATGNSTNPVIGGPGGTHVVHITAGNGGTGGLGTWGEATGGSELRSTRYLDYCGTSGNVRLSGSVTDRGFQSDIELIGTIGQAGTKVVENYDTAWSIDDNTQNEVQPFPNSNGTRQYCLMTIWAINPARVAAQTITDANTDPDCTWDGNGVEYSLAPCLFNTPPNITITEDDTFPIIADGNPIRVDASPLTLEGWYSGRPNGPGCPLDGYETARGTGTDLGDYWE